MGSAFLSRTGSGYLHIFKQDIINNKKYPEARSQNSE
jgi:hypothetical protein